MKKEVVYSLRMRKSIKDALRKAAQDESRTVASLLDKIIKEYLGRKGLISVSRDVVEQRWFTRKEIFKPAFIIYESGSKSRKAFVTILDISFGGALVAYPKSHQSRLPIEDLPQFDLCFDLSEKEKSLCFQCRTNRIIDSGYGVQVGTNFINTNQSDLRKLRGYFH